MSKISLHQIRLMSPNQGVSRAMLPPELQERIHSLLLPVSHSCCYFLACGPGTPISASTVRWPYPLLSIANLCLTRIHVIAFKGRSDNPGESSHLKILQLITCAKTCSIKHSRSNILRNRMWAYLWEPLFNYHKCGQNVGKMYSSFT